jgi:hypothetical protein
MTFDIKTKIEKNKKTKQIQRQKISGPPQVADRDDTLPLKSGWCLEMVPPDRVFWGSSPSSGCSATASSGSSGCDSESITITGESQSNATVTVLPFWTNRS